MSKRMKRLGAAALVGAATGIFFYFFKKSVSNRDAAKKGEFEKEEFELDDDLKPAAERGYVPLSSAPQTEDSPVKETPSQNNGQEAKNV